MPGIVGIIGRDLHKEKEFALQQMVKCMMHEPSYRSKTYANDRLGLWIGWVGYEGSFDDCMPVWNETNDVCVIFSGEDYTDLAEIESLRSRGHDCNSEHASYLVHFYEEMGLEFIGRLNGRFSGVVVDLREKIIVLFNDRYGLGRIYYHENAGGFYFSSEAKSLLKVLPELRQIEFTSLGEVFSYGCVLQNRTLFNKVSIVPGGSRWIFSGNHDVRKESYFNRELWEMQTILSGAEYYDRLKETFSRILPRYFRGGRKVAMSLTGGLDGRMMMAWLNRPPGDLTCYSFRSIYRDSADVRIARHVAELCNQHHETIVVNQEFFSEFPFLAEKAVFISDGTMDVSGSVELYINKLAHKIAPVRLTGNYGSEILRGGVAFRPGSQNKEILEPEFAQLVESASAIYSSEFHGHRTSFIAFKQVPWHHYSRLSVEVSQITMRTPYLDNDLVSLVYQAPADFLLSNEPSLRLISDGNKDLARIPSDRGLLYQPVPFLTRCRHLYEEFVFRAEYAYDYGMPHWLVKVDHMLEFLKLERCFLGRHKFYHFRLWYRNELSRYIKDVLLDPKTLARPYLDGRHVEKIVKEHTQGQRNYTLEIHRILTTELTQRQLIEMN